MSIIGSFAISGITSLLSAVGIIVAFIIGLFVTIATWLTIFALSLNEDVVSSGVVNVGMQITSSLANLGFIFILIIIAIATILRRQSYGAKQLLAKLIIAALLVNFSLLIATSILNFSNVFTEYFIAAMPGGGGGLDNFASAIGTAFSPQSVSLYFLNSTSTGPAPSSSQAFSNSSVAQASGPSGNGLAVLFMSVTNVFFAIFFSLAILITILSLAVMLLIRYVYIVVLLILMPLAWVTWITPLTSNLWQKWWDHFIKWTFFPPLVMMFVYIAFHITADMNAGASGALTAGQSLTASLPWGAGAVTIIGDEIALIGLVIGGLIAANSMGITGAKTAIGAATGVGKSVGGWMGNKTKKGGAQFYKSLGGQRLTNAMLGSRIPGFNRLGMALNQAVESGSSKLVDEEKKKLDAAGLGNNVKQLKEIVANESAPTERRLAALAKLKDLKSLDAVSSIPIENMGQLLGSAENYGQNSLAKEVDKKSLGMYMDKDHADKVQDAARELEQAKANNDQTGVSAAQDKLSALLKDKMEKGGYSQQDMENVNKNLFTGDSFGGLSSGISQSVAQAVNNVAMEQSPKTITNVMKSSNIQQIKSVSDMALRASATKNNIAPPKDIEVKLNDSAERANLVSAIKSKDDDFKKLNTTILKIGLKRATGF